jgi:hypothetical protein
VKLTLVDSSGRVWAYPATELARALGRANPDIDIWTYAIERMGAVEIALENDVVTLSWCAAKVTKRAVWRTERLLATLKCREIRFQSEVSSWSEVFHEPPRLVDRLRHGCLPAVDDPPRPAFLSQSRPLEYLAGQPLNQVGTNDDRLALLFGWWRSKQGHCTQAELLEFYYRCDLIDRGGAVSRDSDGDLRFMFAGTALDGYQRYDPSWPMRTTGRRFIDQPDAVYGAWLAHVYRQVLASQSPRFDFVDATIRMPGAVFQHTRYDRLLLPWQLADGTATVGLLSFKRPTQTRTEAASNARVMV